MCPHRCFYRRYLWQYSRFISSTGRIFVTSRHRRIKAVFHQGDKVRTLPFKILREYRDEGFNGDTIQRGRTSPAFGLAAIKRSSFFTRCKQIVEKAVFFLATQPIDLAFSWG